LARELRITAKLIKGDDGVFDVVADGKLVYSKHATGRFPEEDEIVAALRALV
jgi:selT/selW/selH-like putative selenoprotein